MHIQQREVQEFPQRRPQEERRHRPRVGGSRLFQLYLFFVKKFHLFFVLYSSIKCLKDRKKIAYCLVSVVCLHLPYFQHDVHFLRDELCVFECEICIKRFYFIS